LKRVFIDTNVYSAFKRGDPAAVARIQEAEQIAVCAPVLGELLAGFKCGSKEAANVAELEQFLDSPRVSFVPSDATTAEFYSEVCRNLKRKGKPIPTNDVWIAASAMQHGLGVCSRDRHFEDVDGLLTVIV
jgi:predicted nucleic acid-binding protein